MVKRHKIVVLIVVLAAFIPASVSAQYYVKKKKREKTATKQVERQVRPSSKKSVPERVNDAQAFLRQPCTEADVVRLRQTQKAMAAIEKDANIDENRETRKAYNLLTKPGNMETMMSLMLRCRNLL